MPFTGSSTQLKSLILANLTPLLPDPAAIANLDAFATALSLAMEQWMISAGANSVQSIVAPGQAVTTAGSPTAQAGATVSPGNAIGNII